VEKLYITTQGTSDLNVLVMDAPSPSLVQRKKASEKFEQATQSGWLPVEVFQIVLLGRITIGLSSSVV
jgi:hypothetical protein